MNFATLKGLTIPEGAVKKITDASGAVLWSAKKNVKVTITSKCEGIVGETANIFISSPEPFADPDAPAVDIYMKTLYVYEEPNFTIELPVGTTIDCTVDDTKQSNRCYVSVNGVNVLSESGFYTYTVTKDVSIHMQDKYAMGEYGMITITE